MGMELAETISIITALVSTIAAVIALFFNAWQVRSLTQWNRREKAIGFSKAHHDDLQKESIVFENAFPMIDGTTVDVEEIKAKGPEVEHAIVTILNHFENMGLAVAYNYADADVIYDLCGNELVRLHTNLMSYMTAAREAKGNCRLFEKFDSLVETMKKIRDQREHAEAPVRMIATTHLLGHKGPA